MKLQLILIIALLVTATIPINVESQTYENAWGKLEVYPDTSTNIITQTQYANLTMYLPDNDYDVAFRFDIVLTNANIWLLQNKSHQVKVLEYGWNWINNTANQTSEKYWGVVNYHYEEQWWPDWVSIKHMVEYTTDYGRHDYILKNIHLKQDKTYRVKWQYDVPLGSNGKWDLLAKLHSETIPEALASGHYVHLDPWWDAAWNEYVYIIINSFDYVETHLDDFPVKVEIPHSIGQYCDDGDSVRFLDVDNATEYYYHFEGGFNKTGTTIAWVNVTDVEPTNTTFLMYYNNTAAPDNQNEVMVWNELYGAVYHFNQSSTLWDATINRNQGTKAGAGAFTLNNGPAARSINTSACTGYFSIPRDASFLPVDGDWTFEWFQAREDSPSDECMFAIHLAPDNIFIFEDVNEGTYTWDMKIRYNGDGAASLEIPVYNIENYITGSYDYRWNYYSTWWHPNCGNFSVNMTAPYNQTCGSTGTLFPNANAILFAYFNFGDPLYGMVDEIRISKAVRNESYRNATKFSILNEDFVTIMERPLPPSNIIIAAVFPSNNSAWLCPCNATIGITYHKPTGTATISWYIYIAGTWTQIGENLTNVGNGTYYKCVTLFEYYNTSYEWKVKVNDSADSNVSVLTVRTAQYPTNCSCVSSGGGISYTWIVGVAAAFSIFGIIAYIEIEKEKKRRRLR